MSKKDVSPKWRASHYAFIEKNYLRLPPFEIARQLSYAHTAISVKSYMARQGMLGLEMGVRSFYTATELFNHLGIARKRFQLWKDSGLETLQEIPGETFLYVTKAAFIEFVKRKPTYVWGISKDKLSFFLPTELVDLVSDMPREALADARKTSFPKRVKCVRSGFIYPSISEAERAYSIHPGTLKSALRKGCRCKGLEWQIVD